MQGRQDGGSLPRGIVDGLRQQLSGEVVPAFGQRHRHLTR